MKVELTDREKKLTRALSRVLVMIMEDAPKEKILTTIRNALIPAKQRKRFAESVLRETYKRFHPRA